MVCDFIQVMPGMPKGKVRSRVIMTPQNAKRFMKALIEKNIAIPTTIAVAGFDGSYLNNPYIRPSLTTITINHYAWGQGAALFLIQTLQQQASIKSVTKPIGEIMMKEST
jgi:DNA-binding LacI/PurR family transcriptional regulator